MLQKLGEHIAACRKKAEECEQSLAKISDDAARAHLAALCVQWRHLAASYEFVGSLELFLLDAHRNALPHEVEKLPKGPPDC